MQLAATRPRGECLSSRGGAPVGPPATPYSPCTARRPAAHRADGGSGGATFGGRWPSAEGGRATRPASIAAAILAVAGVGWAAIQVGVRALARVGEA